MKKIIAVATVSAVAALGVLCTGFTSRTAAENDAAAKKEIVVTIAPLHDWLRNVLGDHAAAFNVSLLQKGGADLHSFKPSAEDVVRVTRCALFVHVGGESDEWAEGILSKPRAGRKVLNCLEMLGDLAKDEETVEGMQAEEEEHEHAAGEKHDEKHEHAAGEKHDEDHEKEKDEHFWLSLRMASRLVPRFADALADLDPVHAADYRANAQAYVAKLKALDARFVEMVKEAKRRHVLVADRFPFRYLVDDYGLTYHAAFVGCSAETEASFKTVAFLAKKVDELALPCVLALEGSDRKIARTVVRTSKGKSARILTVDSLQQLSKDDYLTAMAKNLAVFAEALK